VPEINFIIDATTGELQVHIQGIAGPACDDVVKLVKELTGDPTREELTAEYHLRARVRGATQSQIKTRRV
jgi:hypothetical protein